MVRIDEKFQKQCQDNLDRLHDVVITVSEMQNMEPSELGLTDTEEIGGSGIFKGSLTGRKILELSRQDKIEEIMPDMEVTAF